MAHHPLILGPNQSGGILIVYALCSWISAAFLGEGKVWPQIRLALLMAAGIASFLLTAGQTTIFCVLIGLLTTLPRWSAAKHKCPPFVLIAGLLLWPCFLLGLVFLAYGSTVTPYQPKTIGIIGGGMKTLNLPSQTEVKDDHEATFGALTQFIPQRGWQLHLLKESFTSKDLNELGVVCVINPDKLFTPDQVRLLENFVRQGGGLLVLGDHTDIGGIRGPLNQVLVFTSIRFNYDSALPQDVNWHWKNCLRGALAPSFWQTDSGHIGISVGASLTCGSNARVLLVGDRATSDQGRPSYGQSHLGNMAYDSETERLGGLPLVAEEGVGQGLVQVWGDTTAFQDGIVTHSHRFLSDDLENLRSRRPFRIPRLIMTGLFALLSLVGCCVLISQPTLLYSTIAVSVLAFQVAAASMLRLPTDAKNAVPFHSAVIDASHMPEYPKEEPDWGIFRLHDIFLRKRQMAFRCEDFNAIALSKPVWWTIIAPNKAYTSEQADQIAKYVQGGGHLLLVSGWNHRAARAPVLHRFGLDVSAGSYGSAHNSRLTVPEWRTYVLTGKSDASKNEKGNSIFAEGDSKKQSLDSNDIPTSISASPYDAEIQFQESYPIITTDKRPMTPLVMCWGKPLVVRKNFGHGSVTFIGDSRFCTSHNLGKDTVNAVNMRFLLRCLDQ